MTRSPVEKLEQILAADPGSLAFVELAKLLVDHGDLGRALQVCQEGVEHHPDSVQGRVQWGRALLLSGKPVEAMEQFDRASAIEPDNPYAYNLIGEILIQRKLYRSALPILRRAVALQPSDARVRQWLDQAEAEAADGLVPLADQVYPNDPTRAFVPNWAPPAAAAKSPVPTPPVDVPAAPTEAPPAAPPVPAASEGAGEPTVIVASPGPRPPAEATDPRVAAPPPVGPTSNPRITAPPPLRQTTNPKIVVPPPLRASPSGRRSAAELLGDLPDAPPVPAASIPGVSADEAKQIAQAFESQLRHGYEAKREAPVPFARRHWLALTLAAAGAVAGAVGVSAMVLVRRHYAQAHRQQFLARAQDGLLLDTFSSVTGSTHQLDEVLAADPSNALGRALAAQAAATLWRDYGGASAARQRAEDLLGDPSLQNAAPDAVAAARFLLAEDRKALASEILAVPEGKAGPWTDWAAGEILIDRGDARGALARFEAALKKAPAHVATLLAVGDYYLRAGDPSRAAELFGLAHTASPQSVGAAVGLAESQIALSASGPGAWAEDEKALAQVEAPGPGAIPTAFQVRLDLATARVLAEEGKIDPALARLKAGLADHGDEVAAYAGALADVEMAAGHYAEAEGAARRVLSKKPRDPAGLERLARILLGRGKLRELLLRVSPVGPDPRTLHVLRARADLGLGECVAARREVEATERGPERVVPVGGAVVLALCDARDGHADLARQALERLVALPQPAASALLGLASVEADAGDMRGAVAKARAAVAADGRSYEAHCALGRYLVAAGHPSQGQRELARAVALDADHEEARLALGLIELRSGHVDAARADLEAALAESPSDPGAEVAVARLDLADKQLPEAMRHAARAVSLDPQSAEAHRWHGKIAQASGQRKLAQREAKTAQKLAKAQRRKRR